MRRLTVSTPPVTDHPFRMLKAVAMCLQKGGFEQLGGHSELDSEARLSGFKSCLSAYWLFAFRHVTAFLRHSLHVCKREVKIVSTLHIVVRLQAFLGDHKAHRTGPGT